MKILLSIIIIFKEANRVTYIRILKVILSMKKVLICAKEQFYVNILI